jgi:hypothetical protein
VCRLGHETQTEITMLKRCNRCKRELPLSAFNLDRRGSGKYGRQGRCRECMKVHLAEYHQGTRRRVLSHYSGGSMRCACCGEDEIEFLGIDHVHGDGAQHRREVRPSAIYRWLIRHKFPPGIQVLCHNCNLAKGYYGACPHQDPSGGDLRHGHINGAVSAAMSLRGQASDPHGMRRNQPQDDAFVNRTFQHNVGPMKSTSVVIDRRHAAAVALSKLGASKGGQARAAALSADQRRAIAKKAVAARWARKQ